MAKKFVFLLYIYIYIYIYERENEKIGITNNQYEREFDMELIY